MSSYFKFRFASADVVWLTFLRICPPAGVFCLMLWQEQNINGPNLFLYPDIVFPHQSLEIRSLHPDIFGRFGYVPVVSG